MRRTVREESRRGAARRRPRAEKTPAVGCDEDARHVEAPGEGGGVEASRPAEGDEVGGARVDPLLDGDRPHRLLHRRLDHLHHPESDARRDASPAALPSRARAATAAGGVEANRTGEEAAETPESDVGVGDRRLGAAPAVTGRPGDGPRHSGVRPGERPRGRASRPTLRPPRPCGWRRRGEGRGDRRPPAGTRPRDVPPSMRHTSVDVPPMSKETTRLRPRAAARAAAAVTPPAGPERRRAAARRAAASSSASPPEDRMTSRRSARSGTTRASRRRR